MFSRYLEKYINKTTINVKSCKFILFFIMNYNNIYNHVNKTHNIK